MTSPALEPVLKSAPPPRPLLQRKCSCGGSGKCDECKKQKLQRRASGPEPEQVPPLVQDVLRSPGRPLDAATRDFMEPRFGHDFGGVRVHTDVRAADSARAVGAEAYTVGNAVVFDRGKFDPQSASGRHLLSHELAHVVQQGGASSQAPAAIESADSASEGQAEQAASRVMSGGAPQLSDGSGPVIQRKPAEPYVKKVTVNLTPKQSASLEWEGTPPTDATGTASFPVSTGKGYSDPGDPDSTCLRKCCTDAKTQCAAPWNEPKKKGACCTYVGSNFYAGTPEARPDGWKWWTPIQPYYWMREIALHSHPDVTGDPIGHGCVRMAEKDAKTIYDYSRGKATQVVIAGDASPVLCEPDRKCAPPKTEEKPATPESKMPSPPTPAQGAKEDGP